MSVLLKTRAGKLLYRHLPEEYRYRDNPTPEELGDLEAYLHGFGDLLDRFRATLDQAYADGFSEETDDGFSSQSWVLPYLASLFGTQLVSPDLDGTARIRRTELNRAVQWSKGKGTLDTADDVADVLADAETVMVEGWQRTATTPRLSLPPFRLPPEAARSAMMPLGTPDVRLPMRAVADQSQEQRIDSFDLRGRDADGLAHTETVGWRIHNPRGGPCFPGRYDDRSLCTPDLRSTAQAPSRLGPAPRRVTVHVQSPAGFFEERLVAVSVTAAQIEEAQTRAAPPDFSVGPEELLAVLKSDRNAPAPDRIAVNGNISITDGKVLRFHRINLMSSIDIKSGGALYLEACAVREVTVRKADDAPALISKDCLFDQIKGSAGFVRLEYCTVMSGTQTGVLQASDCIFLGGFDDPGCFDKKSCIRFSRIPAGLDPETCIFANARHNTDARPVFTTRSFGSAGACEIRTAKFGEPGCGVLDFNAPAAIIDGAEGGMEMGAYHHRGHAARLAALMRKMQDQLPLGQELDLRHDPILTRKPPTLDDI